MIMKKNKIGASRKPLSYKSKISAPSGKVSGIFYSKLNFFYRKGLLVGIGVDLESFVKIESGVWKISLTLPLFICVFVVVNQ